MRLLFLNSRSADYLEDQLFSGLTELLGHENVIPYPINRNYYLSHKPYPRNLGHCRTIGDLFGDWRRMRQSLGRLDFDGIVIGSTKRDTLDTYLSFADRIPAALPVVYVDGGDWPEVGGDARRMGFDDLLSRSFAVRAPDLIFKREYLIGGTYSENVYPLPMAFGPAPEFEHIEPKYDVTCWCVESHPVRTQALMLLEDRYDCRANGTVRGQKFRKYKRRGTAYLRELAASRIACNFRGVGWDTLRYWEIPALGSLMLTVEPKIRIDNNFIAGEHVICCRDDLSDMLQLLDYYLVHAEERNDIAAAGRAHAMKYHTYRNRAAYFLEILSEHHIGN